MTLTRDVAPLGGMILWDAPNGYATSLKVLLTFDATKLPPLGTSFWDIPAQLEQKLLEDIAYYFHFEWRTPTPPKPKLITQLNTTREWMKTPVIIEVFANRALNFDGGYWNINPQYWNSPWYGPQGGQPLNTGGGKCSQCWSNGGTEYPQCPDKGFYPGCPRDQCDTEAIFSSDLIRVVRKLTNQPAVPTDPTKFEGYCQGVFQSTIKNQDTLTTWSKAAWLTSPGRATLAGLTSKSVPTYPSNPDQPSSPTTAIVLGAIGGVALLSFAVFCFVRRTKRDVIQQPLLGASA